jgi:hypothetical protein
MAKKEMVCAFSDKSCKNCPLYIGRHYFLCFNPKYRGRLKGTKKEGPLLPPNFDLPLQSRGYWVKKGRAA